MQRSWKLMSVLAVILAVVAVGVNVLAPDDMVSRSYAVPVYMEQGGEKLVVSSGGSVEVQAGGAFQITPGATVDLSVGGGGFENVAVSAPTAVGTATPAAYINSAGVSKLFEVEDGGAVVMSIYDGGVVEVAPTALITSTPALVVNSSGASDVFDFQDGGTSVMSGADGGGISIAAPTAIATAVPALKVDSSGGVSNLFEVRDSATPVLQVHDGGTVTGQVLRYGTAGEQLVCGTTVITDNANVSHGLTTPSFAICSLNAADTADASRCTSEVSGANVTVRVYGTNATPTANGTGASVNWCVVGTP